MASRNDRTSKDQRAGSYSLYPVAKSQSSSERTMLRLAPCTARRLWWVGKQEGQMLALAERSVYLSTTIDISGHTQ